MRLKTESKRLPVRILLGEHDRYKVMSQHSRISGRWPAKELNKVGDDLINLLGHNILMEAEYTAGKEVQIQLTKAVALENNRSSITAAQKAGRANKTTRPESGSGSGSDIDTVSAAANVRATRRQLYTQPQSSPIRQLQNQASPDLLAPELVKKTRKRRALVEDHGEVNMGPRKLRSRK